MRLVVSLRLGKSLLEIFSNDGEFLPYRGYFDHDLVVAAPNDEIAVRSLIEYARGYRVSANPRPSRLAASKSG